MIWDAVIGPEWDIDFHWTTNPWEVPIGICLSEQLFSILTITVDFNPKTLILSFSNIFFCFIEFSILVETWWIFNNAQEQPCIMRLVYDFEKEE